MSGLYFNVIWPCNAYMACAITKCCIFVVGTPHDSNPINKLLISPHKKMRHLNFLCDRVVWFIKQTTYRWACGSSAAHYIELCFYTLFSFISFLHVICPLHYQLLTVCRKSWHLVTPMRKQKKSHTLNERRAHVWTNIPISTLRAGTFVAHAACRSTSWPWQ